MAGRTTERVSDSLIIQIQFQHEDPYSSEYRQHGGGRYESQNLAQKREVLEKAQADHRLLTERRGRKMRLKSVLRTSRSCNITAVGTRRKRFRASAPFTKASLQARSRLVRSESELAQIRRARKDAKGSSASALQKS